MAARIAHRGRALAPAAFLVLVLCSVGPAAAASPAAAAPPVAASPAAAQSEEELFGSGPDLVEEPAETQGDLVSGNFEATEGVELSGSLELSFTAGLEGGSLAAGAERSSPGFSLSLDARPEAGLRIHARTRYAVQDTDLSGELRLEELFADLSLEGYGRLRAGKQAAAWGLGYWWSPADVLSLAPVDELDPEAEREGTLALKYHLPLGLGGLTLYAAADGASSLAETALAGRMEFVYGGAELGLGAFYRPDGEVAPRLLGTASFGLGPLDCYAEAVLSLGSERKLASFEGAPAAASPEGALFSGALGAGYSGSDEEGRWELSASAEYYLNGAGIEEGGSYAENRAALLALVAGGELPAGGLRGYGRHYGALALRLDDLYGTGLGLGLDWLSNLAEGSGYWRVAAAFEPEADLRAEAGFAAYYGPSGGEYSALGGRGSLVASLRLLERATLSLDWPLYGEGAEPRASLVLKAAF